MIPRVLIVAGSDAGGGAGIQADIKTVTMLGGHAMTAITAITAQNTLGVREIMPVPAAIVLAQIDAVVDDIGVDAVKIGMLGSADVARHVAAALANTGAGVPVVVDPVLVATSGDALGDETVVIAMAELFGLAAVITPNIPELARITGLSVANDGERVAAASALVAKTGAPVLAKGGHGDAEMLVDILVEPAGRVHRWTDRRIETRHTHGTGCTLSTAIAVGLAEGMSLPDAIARARAYVRAALLAAPGLGQGHGPMGHGLGRAHFDWRGGESSG